MNLMDIRRIAGRTLCKNGDVILLSFSVSGLATTVYLTGKASFRAAWVINEEERITTAHVEIKDAVKAVWKFYIPAAISGVFTVGSIVGGHKFGAKKTAAAYSLLTVSEKAFSEYQDKVIEQIGEKKEQTVRDDIVRDKVTQTPGANMVIVGPGNVLCYEMHTGRYFNSDMETLRKAENTINAQILRENEANLNDFYHLVSLPHTSYSSCTGWNSDKLMALHTSTVLSEDGRPCIAFDYNYVKPL